jgi:hypothetical protein
MYRDYRPTTALFSCPYCKPSGRKHRAGNVARRRTRACRLFRQLEDGPQMARLFSPPIGLAARDLILPCGGFSGLIFPG